MRHARASAFLIEYWSSGMPPAEAGIGGMVILAGTSGGAARVASRRHDTLVDLLAGNRLRPRRWISRTSDPDGYVAARPCLGLPLRNRSACPLNGSARIVDTCQLFTARSPSPRMIHFTEAGEWVNGRKLSALAFASVVGISLWLLLARYGAADTRQPVSQFTLTITDSTIMRRCVSCWCNARPVMFSSRPISDCLPCGGMAAYPSRTHIAAGGILRTRAQSSSSGMRGRTHQPAELIRQQTHLQRALGGARRAAVHLGFDSNIPSGFRELILDSFSEFSRLVSFKLVATEDAVAIFDLTSPPDQSAIAATRALWRTRKVTPPLAGCVAARAAERW